MSVRVSDKLREALERLDQAIDCLEAGLDAKIEAATDGAPANSEDHAASVVVVERLERLIARVETALNA
jgi:hypothetical protein